MQNHSELILKELQDLLVGLFDPIDDKLYYGDGKYVGTVVTGDGTVSVAGDDGCIYLVKLSIANVGAFATGEITNK